VREQGGREVVEMEMEMKMKMKMKMQRTTRRSTVSRNRAAAPLLPNKHAARPDLGAFGWI